ncbi:hypothetical protein ES703_124752 [subsurface metagenome]
MKKIGCSHNWIDITAKDAKRGKSYLCSECGREKFIPVQLRKISDDAPLYFIIDRQLGLKTEIFKRVRMRKDNCLEKNDR